MQTRCKIYLEIENIADMFSLLFKCEFNVKAIVFSGIIGINIL